MIRFIKAFGAAIAAPFKSIWTPRNLHLSDWFRGLKGSWAKPTFENMAKKTAANPHASRAMRILSQVIAEVPVVVKRGEDVQEDHELQALLYRPNPNMSWSDAVERIVTWLHCAGEFWIERKTPQTGPNRGKARKLFFWGPERFVELIKWDERMPAGFLDRLSADMQGSIEPGDVIGYQMLLKDGRTRQAFTIEEMLHVRTFNPLDEERGLPILTGAWTAIETAEALTDWNKNLARGGGRIPGYWIPRGLQPGRNLSAEQVKEAQKLLDERVASSRKGNTPMVSSGAYDFQEGSMNLKDADFQKSDEATMRKISAVSGVPLEFIGDAKQTSLTDAGLDSAMKALLVLTGLPFLSFVLDNLTRWLALPYGKSVYLAYDASGIEALQEDRNQRAQRIRDGVGRPYMTITEGRREMNLPEEPDGELAMPLGVTVGGSDRKPRQPIDSKAAMRLLGLDDAA